MTRALPEWIGKTPDAPVPPRVRLRIYEAYDGRCQCGCKRKIAPGEAWELDHFVALINGGGHREFNLRPLLTEHHRAKTSADVAEKSKTYRHKVKHYGVRRKPKGRALPGRRDSNVRIKIYGGAVDRATGQPWRPR